MSCSWSGWFLYSNKSGWGSAYADWTLLLAELLPLAKAVTGGAMWVGVAAGTESESCWTMPSLEDDGVN